MAVELRPGETRRTLESAISLARRSSRTSCSSSLTRADSDKVTPGATPSSMSACLTQVRTDSTPYPSCDATRCTVRCVIPNSARSVRTIRTAAAFSSLEYRRVVGFPIACSLGMTPSSFPRSGVSNKLRALHCSVGRAAPTEAPSP